MPHLGFRKFFKIVTCHPVAWLGTIITSFSSVLSIVYLVVAITRHNTSNYLDVFFVALLLPMFFVGLMLIPLGALLRLRSWLKLHPEMQRMPRRVVFREIIGQSRVIRAAPVILLLTMVNLALALTAVIYSYHYVESPKFCGTVCHTVMSPEFHRYQASPHARVACVDCHVGEGIEWFVKAKISGMRQLWGVIRNDYQRPIPAPVHHMRPPRATCEHCHRTELFSGEKLKVIEHFDTDRQNTRRLTVLLMKLGNSSAIPDKTANIHWHVDPNNQIEFISENNQRHYIPWVRLRRQHAQPVEYRYTGSTLSEAEIAAAPKRTMDCLDCHNRPTHIYQMPGDALDQLLSTKRELLSLPYLKRAGMEVLQKQYDTEEIKNRAVAQDLMHWYEKSKALTGGVDAKLLEQAADEVQAIYAMNVFPEMKITWGTYPNHISHIHSSGCLRCHENTHVTATGKAIPSDCRLCHSILALKEIDPPILRALRK